MHSWLAAELAEIEKLVTTAMPVGAQGGGLALAEKLRRRLQDLVTVLSGSQGITCAFVATDGLVFAAHGPAVPTGHDEMAAIAQRVAATAIDAARMASLGRVGQLVIVCEKWKIALIPMGPVVLGIVCPASVALGPSIQAVSPQQLSEETVVARINT